MQYSDEVTNEVIRLHSENEWLDSVIAKVIRRQYDMKIDIRDIKKIIKTYNFEEVIAHSNESVLS